MQRPHHHTFESTRSSVAAYVGGFDGTGTTALKGAHIGVLRQLFMGPETDPKIRQALEHALADMTRQSAEVVDDVSIPEIDQIPLGKLFCNHFKYDIDAYLAQRQPEPPVKDLDAILASQKFRPSIEIRMRDAKAQPPPQKSPACKEAAENARRWACCG